ncbi:MAG: hypothetical protein J6B31_06550 [Bacteroidaceae bacterium]|nr:hypothetical protein [Bacteroidaceae bacterium]
MLMMIPLMSDNKTLAVSMPYACSLVCPRLQSRVPARLASLVDTHSRADRCVYPDCTMRMFTGEHIGSPLPR